MSNLNRKILILSSGIFRRYRPVVSLSRNCPLERRALSSHCVLCVVVACCCRGFGFVTFREPSHVQKVLKAVPHTLDGRTVRTSFLFASMSPRLGSSRHFCESLQVYEVTQTTFAVSHTIVLCVVWSSPICSVVSRQPTRHSVMCRQMAVDLWGDIALYADLPPECAHHLICVWRCPAEQLIQLRSMFRA